MTIQTVELAGQRFVILSEPEFRELERRLSQQAGAPPLPPSPSQFDPVTPFEVPGESASDMLVRERR